MCFETVWRRHRPLSARILERFARKKAAGLGPWRHQFWGIPKQLKHAEFHVVTSPYQPIVASVYDHNNLNVTDPLPYNSTTYKKRRAMPLQKVRSAAVGSRHVASFHISPKQDYRELES